MNVQIYYPGDNGDTTDFDVPVVPKPILPVAVGLRLPRRRSVLIAAKSTRSVAASATTTEPLRCLARAKAGPSAELERYRRGEITEAEYLQTRIELATMHLKGRISAARLVMLKEIIGNRLQTDPSLLEARTRLLTMGPSRKRTGLK